MKAKLMLAMSLVVISSRLGTAQQIEQQLEHATVDWQNKEVYMWPEPTDKDAHGRAKGIGKWTFRKIGVDEKGNPIIGVTTPAGGTAELFHKDHKLDTSGTRVTCFWAENDQNGENLIKQEPTKSLKPTGDPGKVEEVPAILLNTGPFVVIGCEHLKPQQQPLFVQIVEQTSETEIVDSGAPQAKATPKTPFVDTPYGRLVAGRDPTGLQIFLPPFGYPAITYRPRMDDPLEFKALKNTKTLMFDAPGFQPRAPDYLTKEIQKVEHRRSDGFTTFLMGLGEEGPGGRPADVWGYWKWQTSVSLVVTDPNKDKELTIEEFKRTTTVTVEAFVETTGAPQKFPDATKSTVTSYVKTVKELLENKAWNLKNPEPILNRFIGEGWRKLVK